MRLMNYNVFSSFGTLFNEGLKYAGTLFNKGLKYVGVLFNDGLKYLGPIFNENLMTFNSRKYLQVIMRISNLFLYKSN